MIVRSEILSLNSSYYCLHNTIDIFGFKTLFYTCCENINNTVQIYSQDISNSNFFDENNKGRDPEEFKISTIQFYLLEPTARQTVIFI